jgi:hypothetical protein
MQKIVEQLISMYINTKKIFELREAQIKLIVYLLWFGYLNQLAGV